MSTPYLDKEPLLNAIGIINITSNDLISSDSYNESKMLEKFSQLNKNDKILVYKAAIQLAIIGFGSKNYGAIRIDDKNIIQLKELFARLNIKSEEKINAKYDIEQLSARRLLRLFRYQIQDFIQKNNRPSYLWLKYSDKNLEFMNICFPGGEHLVETKDQAFYLLKTYFRLDNIIHTKFIDRLKRVFIARNIYKPLEIEELIKNLKE